MLTRNDQPLGITLNFATAGQFNFATDSVFNDNGTRSGSGIAPGNAFLLLDGTPFRLLDGTFFLLL